MAKSSSGPSLLSLLKKVIVPKGTEDPECVVVTEDCNSGAILAALAAIGACLTILKATATSILQALMDILANLPGKSCEVPSHVVTCPGKPLAVLVPVGSPRRICYEDGEGNTVLVESQTMTDGSMVLVNGETGAIMDSLAGLTVSEDQSCACIPVCGQTEPTAEEFGCCTAPDGTKSQTLESECEGTWAAGECPPDPVLGCCTAPDGTKTPNVAEADCPEGSTWNEGVCDDDPVLGCCTAPDGTQTPNVAEADCPEGSTWNEGECVLPPSDCPAISVTIREWDRDVENADGPVVPLPFMAGGGVESNIAAVICIEEPHPECLTSNRFEKLRFKTTIDYESGTENHTLRLHFQSHDGLSEKADWISVSPSSTITTNPTPVGDNLDVGYTADPNNPIQRDVIEVVFDVEVRQLLDGCFCLSTISYGDGQDDDFDTIHSWIVEVDPESLQQLCPDC